MTKTDCEALRNYNLRCIKQPKRAEIEVLVVQILNKSDAPGKMNRDVSSTSKLYDSKEVNIKLV